MEDKKIIEENQIIPILISKDTKDLLVKVSRDTTHRVEERMHHLVDRLKISEDEINIMLSQLGLQLNTSMFSEARFHTLNESKRYLISSAQNGSPVNVDFLQNMKVYAEFINAEIGIIATRYKNPTSLFIDEDVWAEEVQPYLTANRQFLHQDLLLLADLKIQATSPNPTNGIELFGDGASVIVGSPRIEMRSVPVLPTQKQKFLYSTGTTTVPNFTDSVAGGKAEAHHSFGFVIVEIESDEVVHLRSVSADEDGNFNDLIYRVENGEITHETVECLVWGDSHFAQKDDNVTNAFRGVCESLGVTTSVLHDVFDSKSMNVHNEKDFITKHKLWKTGEDDLQKELDQMYDELNWFEDNMKETIIVSSNHDDMLDRAMKQGDWRNNLKNAEIFLDMLKLTLSLKAENGIIPYYINEKYNHIYALGMDDSYVLHGVEVALHGHRSSNGSKGNIQSFSRLSQKTIIGHSHSPAIRWGCYQVGLTCGMEHGYNKGLTSWAYASCTLNKYGKRQMIILNKETLTYTTLY